MATKKQVTLSQFNAWLEGIEELQETNWSPDAKQWKTIRNRIKCIVEAQPQPQVFESPRHRNNQSNLQQSTLPPPAPEIPSSIPNIPVSPTRTGGQVVKDVDGERVIQTPNLLDGGEYKTQFS